MMNPQVKQKWIDALRSGEYNQGSYKLRSGNGYCCLGVLCDIYAKENNSNEWDFFSYDKCSDEENPQPLDCWYFGTESEVLPQSVMDWAGLTVDNPQVLTTYGNDNDCDLYQISDLNDAGYSFTQLANIIQQL